MNRKKLISSAVAAALVASAAAYSQFRPTVLQSAAAEALPPAAAEPGFALPDFTQLVAKASPAVVSIRVSHLQPAGFRGLPPGIDRDDPMFEFFRRFQQRGGEMEQPPERGEGSGFVITADGYILTNAHVVADADEVQVMFSDKRELPAKVIGIDETSDVAVIKVDASGLPTLAIGNAEALKVGEWVIAIGSPFGFDHTVSAGVVSAKTRSLPNGGYVPFIQTDVAINPGNSGGPLLNLRGEVVGMNSQIYSHNGGYMGLSFAIPIDVAMNIEEQLVRFGKVTRGRLGVVVQTISQELAQSFGLATPAGALVSQVQPGTPAALAGIRSGDVIKRVGGKPIEDSAALSRLIAEQTPGEVVTVEIVRGGKTETLKVAIGEAPSEQLAENAAGGTTAPGRLGVVVRPLDEATRQALKADHGVLVEQAGGAAAKAGIRAGDIILAVNTEPVATPDQLAAILDKAPDRVALLVHRDDADIYIPVKLGS